MANAMYVSKSLDSSLSGATMPMMQLQGRKDVALWVPLEQDWSNRWCTLPQSYQKLYERIDDFETRASDVFVVTFMKCGTTWMQELAWLLLNQLDYDQAKCKYIFQRSVFLEYSCLNQNCNDSVGNCNKMPNPRLIKSHLPAQTLPPDIWRKNRKIIYVARNPKDVIISSYHFMKGVGHWQGQLNDYVNEFMMDRIMYTSYWSHIIDFYRMRNQENIFFVTYEEMKRDLRQVIEKLCQFLNCKNLNNTEMEQLLKHLSFENMKSSEFGNPTGFLKVDRKADKDFEFMRRGIVGSYKDELTAEQCEVLDSWTENYLKEYGLTESDIFGHVENESKPRKFKIN